MITRKTNVTCAQLFLGRGQLGWLRVIAITVLIGASTGCFSPLRSDEAGAGMTLDFSGLIYTLQQVEGPNEDGLVLDVYLFDAANVSYQGGDSVNITSRRDAILVDGQPYVRFVVGAGASSPSPYSGFSQDTASVTGVPSGGPYVLLVLVWDWDWPYRAWITADGDQLKPFLIRAGQETRIRSDHIWELWDVFFDDGESFSGGE